MTFQYSAINDEDLGDAVLRRRSFVDDAVRILSDARDRAIRRRLLGVVPELIILWSMLMWERNLGTVAIAACGVDVGSLRSDIDCQLEALASTQGVAEFDFTKVSEIVKNAIYEAEQLGASYVGPEHLALALSRSNDQNTTLVLDKHGLRYQMLKKNVKGLLGE